MGTLTARTLCWTLKGICVRTVIIIAMVTLLSGCATIMEGTGQSVTVSTDPAGAACTIDRAGTRLGQVNPTPGSLHIDKSKNDLQGFAGTSGSPRKV